MVQIARQGVRQILQNRLIFDPKNYERLAKKTCYKRTPSWILHTLSNMLLFRNTHVLLICQSHKFKLSSSSISFNNYWLILRYSLLMLSFCEQGPIELRLHWKKQNRNSDHVGWQLTTQIAVPKLVFGFDHLTECGLP